MPPYTPDSPSVITTATVIKVRRIPRPSISVRRPLISQELISGKLTNEHLATERNSLIVPQVQTKNPFTYIKNGDFDLVWPNIFIFTIAHLVYFYSLYYILIHSNDIKNMYTWMFGYFVGVAGGMGITAGAHRLWSHKSYDAKLPLRIFLMIGN